MFHDPTFTPDRIVHLIEMLPQGSQYMANKAGLPEGRDWGLLEWLTAAVINAVNLNPRATGWWAKGKAPDFPIVKGPLPPEPKPKQSLRGLYAALQAGTHDEW